MDDHVYDTLEPEEGTDTEKGTPNEDEDDMYEDVVLPSASEGLPFVTDHYARSKSTSSASPSDVRAALTTGQKQRSYTGSLVDLRFQPAPPPISSLPPSRPQTVQRDGNSAVYTSQQAAFNNMGRRHAFHKCRSESDTGMSGTLPIERPIGSVEGWQQHRVTAYDVRSSFMPEEESDSHGRNIMHGQENVQQYRSHQPLTFQGSPNISYIVQSPDEYHSQVDRRFRGPPFPHHQQPTTPTLSRSHAHSDVTYVPALPPRHPSSEHEQTTPTSDIPAPYHKYENDIQRATVPPLPAKPNRGSTSSIPPSDKEQPLKESTSITDSQGALDQTSGPSKYVCLVDLSVENLVDYMKVLKLDKYTQAFEEQLVDGEVLSHFDADVLKGEFGFSAVEAIRMMSFIKSGHVPNYGRTT